MSSKFLPRVLRVESVAEVIASYPYAMAIRPGGQLFCAGRTKADRPCPNRAKFLFQYPEGEASDMLELCMVHTKSLIDDDRFDHTVSNSNKNPDEVVVKWNEGWTYDDES